MDCAHNSVWSPSPLFVGSGPDRPLPGLSIQFLERCDMDGQQEARASGV
jgi:hypothetical protein